MMATEFQAKSNRGADAPASATNDSIFNLT
jgi:hypothetical protein